MQRTDSKRATLDDWISSEAIAFSIDSSESFNAAVDQVVVSLDGAVELLGFGEALHGGEEILILRNRLFQRLVEAHGYTSIVIESSFPSAPLVNDYIAGRGPASYEEVCDTGFSHGFGRVDANRELVEWMRGYNADSDHPIKLQFYGFDLPGRAGGPASPGQVVHFVLDYLALIDSAGSRVRRERLDSLLGPDSNWEDPMAWRDPARSADLVSAATSLRIEIEDLIMELHTRRPELVAKSDHARYLEAVHCATFARQILSFFATLARDSGYAACLGVRDALMADTLAYIVSREQGRGKVFVFAHNGHLQRGQLKMPIDTEVSTWWPAGAHLNDMLGNRYAVIGSAVGESEANGIGRAEEGSLEARLTAVPGPVRLIPTHKGEGISSAEFDALPRRSTSKKNPTYAPLGSQSLTDLIGWRFLTRRHIRAADDRCNSRQTANCGGGDRRITPCS